MKSCLTLSILFFCSIGLTSCRSRNEIPTAQTDINLSNPLDVDDLEENVSVEEITPKGHAQNKARVYYFDEFVKQYGSVDAAFSAILSNTNVIIDFYADWCGPCKTLGTLLTDIAPKSPSILIVKINIEDFSTIAQQFDVKTLPTLLFFKRGTLAKRVKGFNKKEILNAIKDIF